MEWTHIRDEKKNATRKNGDNWIIDQNEKTQTPTVNKKRQIELHTTDVQKNKNDTFEISNGKRVDTSGKIGIQRNNKEETWTIKVESPTGTWREKGKVLTRNFALGLIVTLTRLRRRRPESAFSPHY